ncbi:hypothetical protein CAEBREN_04401 [Caenorhabditis brenneri]|uniref:Uncharacterized protein n=1 Tax=Caenorhabditis brenneri TaxID=135651 RepID=G0N063_CAEBE|nr:hypothetical protein CAEBREN_04401 [Caenorhabditis brenneri]
MTKKQRFLKINGIEDVQQGLFASKDHIAEMLRFIGGFENWSVLPEECRSEVVKYVDYKSRCKLGVCSRKDHETVKNAPIYVENVEIEESPIRGEHKVTVRVAFDRENFLNQYFTQIAVDPRSQHLSSNCHKKAAQFAEKWIKKGKFQLNQIVIQMTKFPFEASQLKTLPHCKYARFEIDDMDSLNWFIEKLPEQLGYLSISEFSRNQESFTVSSNILSKPQVTQASRLNIGGRAEFTNEQFLRLKAKELEFDSVNVTAQGINQYIKNWMNGKGVDGFKSLKLGVERSFDLDALMVGLEARYWDEEFEAEAPHLVRIFRRKTKGPCFQIQSRGVPYESLTLNLDEDGVRVIVTGFRGERDGEPCQDYIRQGYYF